MMNGRIQVGVFSMLEITTLVQNFQNPELFKIKS